MGYADGLSLYRAYFVPAGVDPSGTSVTFGCKITYDPPIMGGPQDIWSGSLSLPVPGIPEDGCFNVSVIKDKIEFKGIVARLDLVPHGCAWIGGLSDIFLLNVLNQGEVLYSAECHATKECDPGEKCEPEFSKDLPKFSRLLPLPVPWGVGQQSQCLLVTIARITFAGSIDVGCCVEEEPGDEPLPVEPPPNPYQPYY